MPTDQQKADRRRSTWHGTEAILEEAKLHLNALVAQAPRAAANPSLALRALLVLLGLLGFGGVTRAISAFLNTLAPDAHFEEGSLERWKHHHFARHADEFDAVFIGSSRVFRQFAPDVFDRETRRAGRPTNSFNFGMSGMRHPELRHTANWVLSRKPEKLKWLFLELTGEITKSVEGPLHLENARTARCINWHSIDNTLLLCRALWDSDLTREEISAGLRLHALQTALRYTNTGVGIGAARSLLGLAETTPFPVVPRNGNLSLESEGLNNADVRLRHERFRRRPRLLEEELARLAERDEDTAPDPYLLESLAHLVEEVRSAGVEPIFVLVPPHWREGVQMFSEQQQWGLPRLFAYNDPERFPEFYGLRNLYNIRHLNMKGGEIFTRALARDFLELTTN